MTSTIDPADILQRILATKQNEVADLRARIKITDLMARAADQPPTRGFAAALAPPAPNTGGARDGFADRPAVHGRSRERTSGTPSIGGGGGHPIALIAEVKKASPSKGVIRADFDPVAIARAYHEAGAHCLSVLTDETYFQGRLEYLAAIREAVPLPLLRKDFVIDVAQIYEARVGGADAILVIVATVPSPARIAEFVHVAAMLSMDALVEVHDERELNAAKEAGARLIGVNNRDLKTFAVRLETTLELLPLFPAGALAVAESGIHTRTDVERLRAGGAHAMLVGESLMRAPDIAAATRALLLPQQGDAS